MRKPYQFQVLRSSDLKPMPNLRSKFRRYKMTWVCCATAFRRFEEVTFNGIEYIIAPKGMTYRNAKRVA